MVGQGSSNLSSESNSVCICEQQCLPNLITMYGPIPCVLDTIITTGGVVLQPERISDGN